MKNYDFVVIGGGSAGYAAASSAVKQKLSVAVIEGGEEVGGLCILRGCMPSKTLIESANRYMTIRRAAEFGLRAENSAVHGDELIARKKHLIGDFASYRRHQLENGAFDFIRGSASFVDDHTLEITPIDGAPFRIRAKSMLIATGSVECVVPIPGLAEAGYLDSDALLESTRIPESVIVLGGGPVALEAAHYYAGLGKRVTIIQRSGQVLKTVDCDVVGALTLAYEKRGIQMLLNTTLIRVEHRDGQKVVWFRQAGEEKSVAAEEIIYALGRVPRLSGLEVERAGIALKDERLVANAAMQTNVPHIFAAGDVVGPHEVVHIAIQQGEIAARNAAKLLDGKKGLEEIDYRAKMFVVFSEPQVAVVGSSEKELRASATPYLAASYPFADHGKSMVMGETEGFVKLIVAKESREILGGAVVGPHASDLIHEISVAMHFHGTADDLAKAPHYHPTLSEIWTYPAEELSRG